MYPYLILKHAHMGMAYLSILLFAARGGMMLGERHALLASWPVRILPHVIDSLLLALAVTLVVMGGWPVLHSPWILAKIVGLLLYIVLGTVALKRGKTRQIRAVALSLALIVAGYIVLVAKTKMVVPF